MYLFRWYSIGTVFYGKSITYFEELALFAALTRLDNNALWVSSLVKLKLPQSLTYIGQNAIRGTSITELTIPASVTSIATGGIEFNAQMRTLTCLPTTPPALSRSLSGMTSLETVYVPAASLETYKQANYWSSLASKMVAILE